MPTHKKVQNWAERIQRIKVDRSHGIAPALKKPLLLLLLISRFARGEVNKNEFRFGDIEKELGELIASFGGRPLSSGPKPEQPFLFLRNDGFWNLHFPAGTPERARVIPNVTSLRDSACHASLDPDLYQRLADPELRAELTGVILNQWWPETIQADLITRLGLETRETGAMASRRSAIRSAEFRIRVLENYRHKCTMCGFAVLLNGQPFGLEAAHIRAIQFKGPDQVDNGFALCRIHHVLFDRGAVSVDDDQKVILSQKLIVQDDELFRSITSSRGKRIAKAVNTEPKREYMRWHRSQVFLE